MPSFFMVSILSVREQKMASRAGFLLRNTVLRQACANYSIILLNTGNSDYRTYPSRPLNVVGPLLSTSGIMYSGSGLGGRGLRCFLIMLPSSSYSTFGGLRFRLGLGLGSSASAPSSKADSSDESPSIEDEVAAARLAAAFVEAFRFGVPFARSWRTIGGKLLNAGRSTTADSSCILFVIVELLPLTIMPAMPVQCRL